jgi:hypothetical protein
MSKFDYVKYDQEATDKQDCFKRKFKELDFEVQNLKPGRATSLVYTKLEEAYMWIGKAIRDEQLLRNKDTELQETRCNS